MIDCTNVELGYDSRPVIENFSAHFPQGSITAITGPNGVGKSTLLAALAGDMSASKGDISISGRDISQISLSELSRIRSVAQQFHRYWLSYSVSEILTLGYEFVSRDRLKYIAQGLNIESILEQSVTTLSGGQLQRIEIARALLPELPIILLDEPFASQDLKSIEAIKKILVEEKNRGRTIIMVAHSRLENLWWCDQIIELAAK